MSTDDFYLVLPSNVQPELHPTNTASSYQTTYNESFHLEGGDWEVALYQITYVNAVNNIVNEGYYLQHESAGMKNYYWFNKSITRKPSEFKPEKDDYAVLVYFDEKLSRFVVEKKKPDDLTEYWMSTATAKCLGYTFPDKIASKPTTRILLGNVQKHVADLAPNLEAISSKQFYIHVYGKLEVKDVSKIKSSYECKTHILPKGYYPTPKRLCEVLNPNYKNLQDRMSAAIEKKGALLHQGGKFIFDETEKEKKEQEEAPMQTCDVHFAYNEEEDRVIVALNPTYSLYFKNGLNDILGFKEERIANKLVSVAEKPPIMNRAIYSLYIYCSLCAELQVGNIKAPLLQTVSAEGTLRWGEVKTINLTRLMYVPVACTSFNSVKLEIRDDAGQLIQFGKGKTVITLHLQRKPTKV